MLLTLFTDIFGERGDGRVLVPRIVTTSTFGRTAEAQVGHLAHRPPKADLRCKA